MSKIIVYCEPATSTPEVEEKFQQIREESLDAITELQNHWDDMNKILPISIQKIKISQNTIFQNDVISTISQREDKHKIVLAIFHEEKQYENDSKNWIKNLNSRYILEIIVSDSVTVCMHSKNNFSACIKTDLNDLKNIVSDILLDLIIEKALLKDKDYSKIFKTIGNQTYFNSKQSFIKEMLFRDKQQKQVHPTFPLCMSTFYRNGNGKYEYESLLNTWLIYMWKVALNKDIYIKPPKNKLPYFDNIFDPIDLLPKKLMGQIGDIQNVSYGPDNFRVLIYLRKSLIGFNDQVQARVEALFSGRPKINMIRIFPYKDIRYLNELEHLFYIIPFKLNGD